MATEPERVHGGPPGWSPRFGGWAAGRAASREKLDEGTELFAHTSFPMVRSWTDDPAWLKGLALGESEGGTSWQGTMMMQMGVKDYSRDDGQSVPKVALPCATHGGEEGGVVALQSPLVIIRGIYSVLRNTTRTHRYA